MCTLYDPTDPLFLSVLALGPALGLARFGEFGRFTGSAAELTEIKYEIVSARRSVFIVRLKADFDLTMAG